jgi:hypothetical protein
MAYEHSEADKERIQRLKQGGLGPEQIGDLMGVLVGHVPGYIAEVERLTAEVARMDSANASMAKQLAQSIGERPGRFR